MAHIHPTAIVDPQARLEPDVEVGPWCLIKGQVTIGSKTVLHERVTLRGPMVIGKGNAIYPHATIGLDPQDRKFDPAKDGAGTVIGDRNIIREGVTIHRATQAKPSRLGDDNYLMVNSHLGHDADVRNGCLFANGALLGGHVTVFDKAIVSGNSVVHQFCRIGRLAMLSGHAGVSQDIPPFMAAYYHREVNGLNIVGLRRAGLRDHVVPIRREFDLLFRRGLSTPSALAMIEEQWKHDPLVMELVEFIRGTVRGITPFRGHRGARTGEDPMLTENRAD